MKSTQTSSDMPEIIEILKMTRILKSQIEILEGVILPEEKQKLVKSSLREFAKVLNAYCGEDAS